MSVHGDLDDFIASGEDFIGDTCDFVAENEGYGMRPDHFGKGHGAIGAFDGDSRDALVGELGEAFERAFVIGPRDPFLGAECGFVDLEVRRMSAHAAEMDVFDACGIGSAESGPDVVCAAHVVQNQVNWEARVWTGIGHGQIPLGVRIVSAGASLPQPHIAIWGLFPNPISRQNLAVWAGVC